MNTIGPLGPMSNTYRSTNPGRSPCSSAFFIQGGGLVRRTCCNFSMTSAIVSTPLLLRGWILLATSLVTIGATVLGAHGVLF